MAEPGRVFSAMRLRGGRYERRGFPLEALPELARYERLVLDVAKVLWKQSNPDRRVPRGFAEQLQLRLTKATAEVLSLCLKGVHLRAQAG